MKDFIADKSYGKDGFPPQYFGVVERFSVFAAVGFNAVLGVCLFEGFGEKKDRKAMQ